MNNFGPVIIGLLMTSLGMNIYSLYCLKRIAKKMNWWRNKAVKTNGMVRQMSYDVNKFVNKPSRQETGARYDELDVSIGKS